LINDILDMNKIEAGALELVSSPLKLKGFVKSVAAFSTPEAHRKGLVLTTKEDATLPVWITTDARRLRQILLNLIGNAVTFTSQGRVGVDTRRLPNGQMRIEVSDTGPGIAPDRIDSIFEPFKQAGPSSQRAKGTGLGLAIAREIVHQMGGTLSAESVEGEGSTFRLDLPLVECDPLGEMSEPEEADVALSASPADIPHWPERAVLEELLSLLHQGALSEIAREGQRLAESDAKLEPFGELLTKRARSFDDAVLETFLEEGLSRPN
jgi:anti-sigma regulatory factor (Ser/Thr protein kinase)